MRFTEAVVSLVATVSLFNGVHSQNIVDIASDADDFSTLASLVVQADLDETLAGNGPFLVYAPTNDAFDALPPGVVDFLLANPDELQKVLTYHVVMGGAVGTQDTDITATNGIIRTIDTVLVPSSVSSAFSRLTSNDDPTSAATTTSAAGSAATDASDVNDDWNNSQSTFTVVDAAMANYELNTLVSYVSRAGLVETLSSGDEKFTIFAPEDDAFAELDSVVRSYLESNVAALGSVLTYHVVSGEMLSSQLTNGVVQTIQGEDVEIMVGDSGATVNGYNITRTDIRTANGVIHMIDEVLIPPGFTIPGVECENGGTVYNMFEWATISGAMVCQCGSTGWIDCEPVIGSVCGQACVSDDNCGSWCGSCDRRTRMCVPLDR